MHSTYDIEVVEVGARDGLQNEPGAAGLSAETKVEFIRLLALAGLRRIEAGSFVKPQAVPSMANSAEVAALLQAVAREFPDAVFSYLVPNLKGLVRAREVNAKEVAIFLAVSESFSQANIHAGVDEAFIAIEPVVKEALSCGMRVRGYISNVFGYTDLPFSPQKVASRSKQLHDMGCFEVSLGDTTGVGTPERVDALVGAHVDVAFPLAQLAMHFHDTFGSAIANVERAYDLGIRTFDAATGGLGGCPYANSPKGNLAMEDLIRWCEARSVRCAVQDIALLESASAYIHKALGKKDKV